MKHTSDDPAAAIPMQALKIHESLRAYLLREHGQQPPAAIAFALLYELASVTAAQALDITTAIHSMRVACYLAEDQIKHFGVGHPHP